MCVCKRKIPAFVGREREGGKEREGERYLYKIVYTQIDKHMCIHITIYHEHNLYFFHLIICVVNTLPYQ